MSASSTATDFGAKLRQARERRGISLRQIATSTKISVGVLEALERNDFSKLPGGIFSRAFVRSYALEVGLDPEEIVRQFLASLPSESPAAGASAAPRPVDEEESVFESQQRMAGVALKLVLVSVPIAGVLLYFSLGRGGRSQAPAAPPPSKRASAVAPSGELVRTAPPTELLAVASPPAPGTPADTPVGAPVAPVPGEPPSAPAAGDLLLEIAPVGPCWVSLTIDNEVVIARVVEAGERIVRRVRQDALLQVGDAGACAFAINGRPGRPLGARGEVKSVHITRDNYSTLLR